MGKRTLALVATIIGSGMVVLDGFVVNLALPSIKTSLGAHFSDLQWIIDGFLLSLSSLILIGGSLGDIFGRKKIYLIGLWGFVLVSVLCAVSPNVGSLILFRVLQGIFGALLVPGGLAIINTNFPKEERGRAIGRWSAWLAIVVPIGPVVGGYIIKVASWRWIFLINLPLGIICGYLASRYFIEGKDESTRQVDYWGALLAAGTLAGATYGLIRGPGYHWDSMSIIALIVGALLLFAFLWRERAAKDPMVRLHLFRSRNFSGSNLMTLLMYGALGGFTFILPIYLQTKMGYSAFVAGLSMLPVSILLLTLSSRMGALSSKYGPRLFIAGGPAVVTIAIISLLNYKPGDGFITFLLPRTFLFGLGMAIMVAPLTATVMSSVEDKFSGIASGINNAVARVGGLIVVALLGLAGTGDTYRFSLVLCIALTLGAAISAYLIIRNPSRR
jgi:EmrB/QacA subfamily drug resistance transporter